MHRTAVTPRQVLRLLAGCTTTNEALHLNHILITVRIGPVVVFVAVFHSARHSFECIQISCYMLVTLEVPDAICHVK